MVLNTPFTYSLVDVPEIFKLYTDCHSQVLLPCTINLQRCGGHIWELANTLLKWLSMHKRLLVWNFACGVCLIDHKRKQMAEKTSMDVAVAIIMPYQLETFLNLDIIMSAVKCRSLSCWKIEAGCLSQCLRTVSSPLCCWDATTLMHKPFPTKCSNHNSDFFVNFLSVSFN